MPALARAHMPWESVTKIEVLPEGVAKKKIYAERTDQRGRGSLSIKSEGVCIIKFFAGSGLEGVAIIKFSEPKSGIRARTRYSTAGEADWQWC